MRRGVDQRGDSMRVETETSTGEVQRLRRCIRDLVALSALPAVWIGYDPRRIAESLADVLRRMLHLDLIYLAVREGADGFAIEVAHTAQGPAPADRAQAVGRVLAPWLSLDSSRMPPSIPDALGERKPPNLPRPLRDRGRGGILVAGSRQADFPTEVNRLLLGVGANQAAILLERREAEEQLRQSQRQLTDFVENATEGLHWLGPDGMILWANKAELDLLGYTREEYIGHHIAEFHADPSVIKDIIFRLANKEKLYGYEARLRRKDGTIKHVLVNSDALWEDGKFLRTRCFTRDITERKQTEEALRESEERFRFLAESIPHMVWAAQPDGQSDYYNARFLDYLGMTLEQLQGWTWTETLHPDDQQRTIDAWEHALRNGAEFLIECRIRNGKTGECRWFLGHALPQRDVNGHVVRWFGTCTDIDERKRAERALRESEERLRLALVAGRMGTWDWNILTNEVSWSRELELIQGLEPGTFGGTFDAFLDKIHPEDRESVTRTIAHTVAHSTDVDLEYRAVWPDGSIHWKEGRGKLIRDETGKPVRMLGLGLDITERKRAEEAPARERGAVSLFRAPAHPSASSRRISRGIASITTRAARQSAASPPRRGWGRAGHGPCIRRTASWRSGSGLRPRVLAGSTRPRYLLPIAAGEHPLGPCPVGPDTLR